MLMLIQIGRSIEKKSTVGLFFSLRSSMGYWFGRMESYMVLSIVREKYVATCLTICERGAVNLQYVIQIEISRKRE